ncbi:MAG: hypothetical protein JSR21_18655, partial [Proteobacteria bacterium]|nr:hypothetical protein [Pseudomonadota bacterium]
SKQLVVLLQYAAFDMKAGSLASSTRAWTDVNAAYETKDFQYGIALNGKWITSGPQIDDVTWGYVGSELPGRQHPNPLSPIVGVKLANDTVNKALLMFARTDFYRV